MSDVPPGEIVDGLRNPYLDKFVPPRRRKASAVYSSYKPRQVHFVHSPITDLATPSPDVLVTLLDDLQLRLSQGATPTYLRPLPVHDP